MVILLPRHQLNSLYIIWHRQVEGDEESLANTRVHSPTHSRYWWKYWRVDWNVCMASQDHALEIQVWRADYSCVADWNLGIPTVLIYYLAIDYVLFMYNFI